MDSKKIFLWPVIISIIGHIALVAVSSMVDLRDSVKVAELFTVQIVQPAPVSEPKKEEEPAREKIQPKPEEEKPLPEGGREDTVDIGSSDVKYAAYLADVKKKILPLWKSSEAYKKNDNGIVGVKISLDADGSLAQLSLIASSGFPGLDQRTLDVVRAAAPFQPLPRQYDLSRLHITASFRYSVTE